MTHLNVMTFNIRVRSKIDGPNIWDNRIQSVTEVIEQSAAAIVGIQEARYDMLLDLIRELPDYDWLGSSRTVDDKDEYCPIFYRRDKVTVVDHGTFWLSTTPDVPGSQSWDSSCPRICTWATFEQPSGERITIYNTHLDHISEEARVNGIQVILDFIKAHEEHPYMIMGDLNARPESATIQTISQKESNLINALNEEIARGEAKTFHNFQGGVLGLPIDYIFISNDMKLNDAKIINEQVGGRYPSDHYPILVNVSLE